MAANLKGKAPGSGSGEMSRRTAHLRPSIGLSGKEIAEARRMRREGMEPDAIARAMGVPQEQVERVLLQMRSARPETTRGTLNVTLKAHRLVMAERDGDEPLWKIMDRLLGELLQLRTARPEAPAGKPPARRPARHAPASQAALDL